MESAQDKITGEIVEAEQLWLIENVDKERYVCRGCGIKVLPASYKPTNVVRPYFTTGKEVDHKADCDVDGEKKLVTRGKKERLSTQRDGFPVPYPSRLVLRDERPVVDDGSLSGAGPKAGGKPGTEQSTSADGTSSPTRRRAANTIRPICRTFINFPYDRDLELAIPGIEATNYLSVFKKLKWDELSLYSEAKLFYAAMRWNKPVETDEFLEIALDAGERDETKRLQRGHRIRVEWADWSKSKRTYVRNEIEAARKEAIEAKEKNPKIKGYLFFIGQQDLDDITLFRVVDHRLICCLVNEITYPKFG